MESPTRRPSLASRLAVLAYGTIVYVFFLGVFVYAIGFVTGIGVPKGIDDGLATPLVPALLVNAGLLGLFAVQHMVMARPWFKRRWTKIVPAAAERSTFVLATCLILTAMYVWWRPLTDVVWSVEDPIAAGVLQGLSLFGFGIVLVATFVIDHFDLFGLSQVIRYFRGAEHREPEFRVKSFYRYIRHPLYLGFITAFWATPVMTVGHLVFAVATTGFMLVAVRFEERDLVRLHGPAYEDYRARVPMIFPRPGRRAAPIAVETA